MFGLEKVSDHKIGTYKNKNINFISDHKIGTYEKNKKLKSDHKIGAYK
jgi:hypothetical protein